MHGHLAHSAHLQVRQGLLHQLHLHHLHHHLFLLLLLLVLNLHAASAAPPPPPAVRIIVGEFPPGVTWTSDNLNKSLDSTPPSTTNTSATSPTQQVSTQLLTLSLSCRTSWTYTNAASNIKITATVAQLLPGILDILEPEVEFTYTVTAKSIKYFAIQIPSSGCVVKVTDYSGTMAKTGLYGGRNYFWWLNGWYSSAYQTSTYVVRFAGIPVVSTMYLNVASYHINNAAPIVASGLCGLKCTL